VPEGDSRTIRQHLQRAAPTSDAALQDLVGPPLDARVAHIWWYWCELHSRRSADGMGGFSGLSEERVVAYCALNGIALDPEELDALWAVEYEYRRYKFKLDTDDGLSEPEGED